MRYFPKSEHEVQLMLQTAQKNTLEDLFSSIPKDARLANGLRLPQRLDELQIKREFAHTCSSFNVVSFLGAGATLHFVPEWVSQQLLRAEWYTSYTPYQPEASQGTLQAIFEFQSMVASLFSLPVSNASMYDGATALVEALLMAMRITNKKTVLISRAIHPEYRECVKTYFLSGGFNFIELAFDKNGITDQQALERALKENSTDIAAIAVQSPNFFGRLEEVEEVAKHAHAHDALAIQCVTDMTSLAIISSPGSADVDIAVGEGLGLLGGLNLGGPGLGLLACRKNYLRQMPGRLVGATTDSDGKNGYVLTLSTREQHIRREKATSNICTNHNLMALAFAMTLSAYGKSGLLALAKTNLEKTIYFRKCLAHALPVWQGAHYNETVVNVGDKLNLRLKVANKLNLLAGVSLDIFFEELKNHLLVTCTELHQDDDIVHLAEILCGIHDDKI